MIKIGDKIKYLHVCLIAYEFSPLKKTPMSLHLEAITSSDWS